MISRITKMVAVAMMLLFGGTVFSGTSHLYAQTSQTPYTLLLDLLEAQHFDTSEATLETIVPNSILETSASELKKAFRVRQEVSFPRNGNIGEVLTALLRAKYLKNNKKEDFYKIQYSLCSEDFAKYLEMYPKSKFASEAESKLKCTQQHESWVNAARRGSRSAYEAYARQYGASDLCNYEGYEAISQADNAQVQAIEAWLSLLKSGITTDAEVYSDYLRKYGDYSCFAGEAKDSLNYCLDRNAWRQASEKGTMEAYREYVEAFPNGIHARYAQDKIDDWAAWETACAKNSFSGYRDYLRAFPKGDSAALAQKELIPDEAFAVDLGLPSGTRWAPFNVGAVLPEEYGDYFAWGEIGTKKDFSWKSYQYFTDLNGNGKPWSGEKTDLGELTDIGNDIGGTMYDVAHVKWGGNWRMPTKAQCQELVDKCKWTWWITRDLQEGYKVTGPNGNSIFLPAAGYCDDMEVARAAFRGGYWSSTREKGHPNNAYFLRFKEYDAYELNPVLHDVFANSLRYGRTVRPVTNVKPKQQTSQPSKQIVSFPKDIDITGSTPVTVIAGHNAVDLGLPSGTKWADRNVGSSSPRDFGEYYAWGETKTKRSYDSKTYQHFTDKNKNGEYDYDERISIGLDDISGTEYDVAHVKWGGSWKMPTKEQWQELIDYCTWTLTAQDGRKGYQVTGPNGRVIFLPAAGRKVEFNGDDRSIGRDIKYWSSTKQTWPYSLSSISDDVSCVQPSEIFGLSVRPVSE